MMMKTLDIAWFNEAVSVTTVKLPLDLFPVYKPELVKETLKELSNML